MNRTNNTRTKSICFNVNPLNVSDIFPILRADQIAVGQILDQCGNLIIDLPCKRDDDCNGDCCNNPTTIFGNLEVVEGQSGTGCGDGTIFANNIVASTLEGDGSRVFNTDDTKVINFSYNEELSRLELTTINENIENSQRTWLIPVDDFTSDTKVVSFGWQNQNSNVLVLRDNTGKTWDIDLTRFCNEEQNEIFISKGYCNRYGEVRLEYNNQSMQPVRFSISDAIKNLDNHVVGGHLLNDTLILERNNLPSIRISLHDLIASLNCRPDTIISCIEVCGSAIIIKESNGAVWEISLLEIIETVLDEVTPMLISGGCVTTDNEIFLHRNDGHRISIGQTTDTNTFPTSLTWRSDPRQAESLKNLFFRLNQSDGSTLELDFSEVANRIKCEDTFLVRGEIRSQVVSGRRVHNMALTNNDGTIIVVDGLINSDTRLSGGRYSNYGNDRVILLEQTEGPPIRVDVRRLIEDAQRTNDTRVTNFRILGNHQLSLEQNGQETLRVPLSPYVNIDQSIKRVEFDKTFGVLHVEDVQGKKFQTEIIKETDINNITNVNVIHGSLFVQRQHGTNWMLELPNTVVESGVYNGDGNNSSITLTNSDNSTVTIGNIENTYPVELTLFGNTLRLDLNNNVQIPVNLSPIVASLRNDVVTEVEDKLSEIVATRTGSVNGIIDYHVNMNSVMIKLNVTSTTTSFILGQVPIALPFNVTKYVMGIAVGDANRTPIQINITTDGVVSTTEQLVDSIEDSFVLVLA